MNRSSSERGHPSCLCVVKIRVSPAGGKERARHTHHRLPAFSELGTLSKRKRDIEASENTIRGIYAHGSETPK